MIERQGSREMETTALEQLWLRVKHLREIFLGRVLLPVSPESIITEFSSPDKLQAILDTEGNAFNVLNEGFRDLLSKEGTTYDLKFPYTTWQDPFAPVRITRLGFLLDATTTDANFLVVETDSFHAPIEEKQYDPQFGDISIWPLTKKVIPNKLPFLSGEDMQPDNRYAAIITLTRKRRGGSIFDSGAAVIPTGVYSSREIYDEEEIKKLLQNWVGHRLDSNESGL